MLCRWCDAHIPNRTYSEVWKTLLEKGWSREEIRSRSPACPACADQLKKENDDGHSRAPDGA